MNAVKEFKGSYVKLFSNALHNGFHTTIWKYLRSLEDKTKIHLSDELLTEYGTNIAAETELNRETRAHVNTAALNEADAKRDKAMSYLFNVIEAAKEAVVPDIQAGGMALSVVILPYKGIQQLAHKEESAAIDGCLQDIRKPENSPYVLSLNLGTALSAADEANQEYKDLEQERRDDKRAKKLEPAKVVRPRTDANFKRICDLIYASQLLCTVPEDLTLHSPGGFDRHRGNHRPYQQYHRGIPDELQPKPGAKGRTRGQAGGRRRTNRRGRADGRRGAGTG